MSDIKILWNTDTFEGDIEHVLGDLTMEDGLETAVMMSLFSDRRASIDDTLPDPTNQDLRGWWGDQVSDFPGDEIGSKLWLLGRSKTDQDTLSDAEAYINDSLEWMITDEVAAKIDVEVERRDRGDGSATLYATIKIYQADGNELAIKYIDLWNAQIAA